MNMKAVFIGGCDRSGTTLLGSILGAAPGSICTPESHFKTEMLAGGDHNTILSNPKTVLAAISRHWRFRVWGMNRKYLPRLSSDTNLSYRELIEKIVQAYADMLDAPSGRNIDTWVDHTPANIRELDRLFTLFPDAVALHIVRDGRAVAASVMPLDWGPNTIYFAAKWWVQNLAPGLAAEKYFGEKKVLRVRFEDLVTERKKVLKKIYRFAGIPLVEEMGTGGGFRVPDYTAAQHKLLLGDTINAERVDGWKRTLTKKQVNHFEYVVGDVLAYLSYQPQNTWPIKPTHTDMSKMLIHEATSWSINRIKRFFRKRAAMPDTVLYMNNQ